MNEDQLATKFQALLQTIDALLSRPDVVALIAPQSGEQLIQIRHFVRDWDQHAQYLSHEQKANSYAQLEAVVSILARTVAEFDQLRLQTIPVEQMGKA